MYRFSAFFIVGLIAFAQIATAEIPTLRVGVLKFGTVNWELQTIKSYGLDKEAGFNLEVVPFAGKQATSTALHGGGVDAIVNDWIWVSRQRHEGRLYGFIPYSRMVGALVVKPEIKTLQDLKGKKIGVAGGPVDKSWLLFQAVCQKRYGFDLAAATEVIFGAPPLLSKKLETGELDGVINFWHYVAKLEVKGFKRLLDVKDVLAELGLKQDVPMIGYVFSPDITRDHQDLIAALSLASRKAKEILRSNAQAWKKVTPLMKAKNEAEFQALKTGFLQGIPTKWDDQVRANATALYDVLARLGGTKLVGKTTQLENGTFVSSVRY